MGAQPWISQSIDDAGVRNLIDNHRAKGATDAPTYMAALEEWERRKGIATGVLTVADVDAGEAGFMVQPDVVGTYGTFSF